MDTPTQTFSLKSVFELAKQLPRDERTVLIDLIQKFNAEGDSEITKEKVIKILRAVKPYFRKRLGKNTHKKTSSDWSFYGLAFTKADMVYIFGINLGFFKKEGASNYNYLGMNVLVRTNGQKPEIRAKFVDFFREHLSSWINRPEEVYTSDRGGVGIEFARYIHIDDCADDNQMIYFLKDCIDLMHQVYPYIVANQDDLFNDVVLAVPQWDHTIVEFCRGNI